jgi:hypothetical protein
VIHCGKPGDASSESQRYNEPQEKSVNQIISIAGIAVAGAIALIIAYQQRRQMRQIEAHREDPTVPLKPPPSPFWAWSRKYSSFFLMLIPLLDLYQHSRQNTPVTVGLVIDIAFQVGMILFLLIMFMFERILAYQTKEGEVLSGIIRGLERITAIHFKQS